MRGCGSAGGWAPLNNDVRDVLHAQEAAGRKQNSTCAPDGGRAVGIRQNAGHYLNKLIVPSTTKERVPKGDRDYFHCRAPNKDSK